MRRVVTGAGLILLLAGCGGSDNPTNPGPGPRPDPDPDPPPPTPITVVVVVGSQQGQGPDAQRLTLQLRNDGGPGTYAVEAYGFPTSPNGPDTFFGRSEPVEVTAEYEETVSYDIEPGVPPVNEVVVFGRDAGSAIYRETDRYDVPNAP